jgi:hypothetical protein
LVADLVNDVLNEPRLPVALVVVGYLTHGVRTEPAVRGTPFRHRIRRSGGPSKTLRSLLATTVYGRSGSPELSKATRTTVGVKA